MYGEQDNSDENRSKCLAVVSTQILNVKVQYFIYDLNFIFSLVFVCLSIDNYDAKLQQLTGW